MIKIGILTFHFVNNSGAILQCIALQRVLSKLTDVEVEVINYQPYYHTNMYSPITNPFLQAGALVKSLGDKNIAFKIYRYFRNVASSLVKNVHFIERYKKRGIFEEYYKRYLKLSALCRDTSHLRNCRAYDLYIVGSDQLWNSHITNYAIDYAYYLNFVKTDYSRRITYAVSGDLLENEVHQVTSLLNKFDSISVRERKTFNQLHDILLGKDIRIDLDPTMLLTKGDYSALEEKWSLPEKYILFYGLATSDPSVLVQALEQLELRVDLPVIDISSVSYHLKVKTIKKKYFSPGQFLSAIKGAGYVVTNSFHGTAFSILYNRSFYTVLPALHPERLEYLLEKLELKDRIVTSNVSPEHVINWDTTNKLLENERQDSKEYLYSEVEKTRKRTGYGD